jgi:hypothetical protein
VHHPRPLLKAVCGVRSCSLPDRVRERERDCVRCGLMRLEAADHVRPAVSPCALRTGRFGRMSRAMDVNSKSPLPPPAGVAGQSDRLSQALSSALAPSLLRPLIGIVCEYARAADWSRVTVQKLVLARTIRDPSAVVVDPARGRIVWTDYDSGSVCSVSISDLAKMGTMNVNANRMQAPAGPPAPVQTLVGQPRSSALIASDPKLLGHPSSIAIEPVTHWPAGTDPVSAAAAAAAGFLVGQVGAGALWVTNEEGSRVIRIDESAGTACVVAGSRGGYEDGPGPRARFQQPTCIVWDAVHERALVADQNNHRIRAITRAPPPPRPPPSPASTVSVLSEGDGKGAGSGAASEQPVARWSAWIVSTIELAPTATTAGVSLQSPIALALDPIRPHTLCIACRHSAAILVADLLTGTLTRSVAPTSGAPRWSMQCYGLLVDPLSSEHLLMTCSANDRVYRLSLADGVLLEVSGVALRGVLVNKGVNMISGLAQAPRELSDSSDALTLVLCDMRDHRLYLIHVPF